MKDDRIKTLAARCIADGLRRSAAIEAEAWQQRRLAEMMTRQEGEELQISADGKFAKAARIRQLCGRLAAAHGIGPKRTGRGGKPRPVQMKNVVTVTGRLAHAR